MTNKERPMQFFDRHLLQQLLDKAHGHERQRINHNVHPTLEDPVQRFFNALTPQSYVRPHRHKTPLRWECFIVLQGCVRVLCFDDLGKVLECFDLDAQGSRFGVELPAGTWHAMVALEPSVFFEVKEGPYELTSDKDFASWAPAEKTPQAEHMPHWYRHAKPGDHCRLVSGHDMNIPKKIK